MRDETLDFAVLQQAAQWYARLGADDVSESDRERWQRWLEGATAHRAAWQQVEAISRQFGQLPATPAMAVLDGRAAPTMTRRGALKLLSVAGVTGAAAWLGVNPPPQWLAEYNTAVGERRELPLADGSRLWLNTASSANVRFSRAARCIELLRGEVFIATAHDPRPLTVETRHGSMRALGTRFSVRLNDAGSQLAVFEGAVAATPAHGATSQLVVAGQQLRVGLAGGLQPADAQREAWSRGVLLADNLRLDIFVDELARYRRGHIAVAPDVAHLRLVGAYPLADTDDLLAAITQSLPVRVRQILPWWLAIEAIADSDG